MKAAKCELFALIALDTSLAAKDHVTGRVVPGGLMRLYKDGCGQARSNGASGCCQVRCVAGPLHCEKPT
jgi:hypothetical protein